jgi:hypothetical protein
MPAAPKTASDPLICPFAVLVFAAVVAAALASLLPPDLLVELVMNPLDGVESVFVASGVAVPLKIVTPEADWRVSDAVRVAAPVAAALKSLVIRVSCPALFVDATPEKGVRDISVTCDTVLLPSTA